MGSLLTPGRILAVDVRPRRAGYAVFEASAKLLDVGVTEFRSPQEGVLRVASLASKFHPAVIVLRKLGEHTRRDRPRTNELVRLIGQRAKASSIRTVFITARQVKRYFEGSGIRNKDQMAILLAQECSELGWKIPPPRKAWQTEHWNMPIFDASALAFTFIALASASDQMAASNDHSSD